MSEHPPEQWSPWFLRRYELLRRTGRKQWALIVLGIEENKRAMEKLRENKSGLFKK